MSDESKMATAEQFKKIRESTGMNRKEFADYLKIPYRTMQEWELGRRTMPDYVMELVDFRVKHDPELIKEKKSVVEKLHEKKQNVTPEPAKTKNHKIKEERA